MVIHKQEECQVCYPGTYFMVNDLESIAEMKWKDNVLFPDYKLTSDSLNENG